MVSVREDRPPDSYVVMLTRSGLIKRTPLAAFSKVTKARGISAIKLRVRAGTGG